LQILFLSNQTRLRPLLRRRLQGAAALGMRSKGTNPLFPAALAYLTFPVSGLLHYTYSAGAEPCAPRSCRQLCILLIESGGFVIATLLCCFPYISLHFIATYGTSRLH